MGHRAAARRKSCRIGAADIWMTAHNGFDPPRSNPMFLSFPSSDESRPRRLVSSRLVATCSSVSWVSRCGGLVCGGGSAAHHREVSSVSAPSHLPRRDSTDQGVEASALCREKRNTQDN